MRSIKISKLILVQRIICDILENIKHLRLIISYCITLLNGFFFITIKSMIDNVTINMRNESDTDVPKKKIYNKNNSSSSSSISKNRI